MAPAKTTTKASKATSRRTKLLRSSPSMDLPDIASPSGSESESEPEPTTTPKTRKVGRPRKYKSDAAELAAIRARHLQQAEERAKKEFARRHDPAKKAQRRLKALQLSVKRARARAVSKQKELDALVAEMGQKDQESQESDAGEESE
jgi:hypothetical protein